LNKMPDIGKQMSSTMQDFAKQMQTTGAPISEEVRKASAQMQSSGSVEEKLDILNQTMLQLVGINNMQTQIGQKQIKAFKHSGNLMGGIGRV
jgi:TolA-binding protein